jgi:hypothetical protein
MISPWDVWSASFPRSSKVARHPTTIADFTRLQLSAASRVAVRCSRFHSLTDSLIKLEWRNPWANMFQTFDFSEREGRGIHDSRFLAAERRSLSMGGTDHRRGGANGG